MQIQVLAGCALALGLAITALAAPGSAPALYDVPLKDIDGKDTSLKAYEGKVLLIVNVASRCGFTKQYKPLESVYRKYKDQGLVVLGFPSNDFGDQEPGSNSEIKEFCSGKFDVTFPMFDKVGVKPGPSQHPLYTALTGQSSPAPGPVGWNFGKFLVSRDGKILARFGSKDEPDSEQVIQAIEKALKKP
ncbi:MAG TPA: glutathione peroxidase [Clostridia bacterium]|nr:glutathione peroxidase [Clostridia bacterium]